MLVAEDQQGKLIDVADGLVAERSEIKSAAGVGVTVFVKAGRAIDLAGVDFDIHFAQRFAVVLVGDFDLALVLADLDGERIGVIRRGFRLPARDDLDQDVRVVELGRQFKRGLSLVGTQFNRLA